MKFTIVKVKKGETSGTLEEVKDFPSANAAYEYAETHGAENAKIYAAPFEHQTTPSFRYVLLDRMKQDCKYFLGNGYGLERYLWAHDVLQHIHFMKAIWYSFQEQEKPDWLTLAEIGDFMDKMLKLKASKPKIQNNYPQA